MSAFEVTISPTRPKPKKRPESHQPTEVIMAPFSAKAIVQFEDVPVKKTAKRLLRIINPSEDEIEIKVTKPIKVEYNISIDWSENTILAHSEIQMEMIWSPLEAVTCMETIQLTDSRNFRKDIMIILKSSSVNKSSKSTRKFPTMSSGAAGAHVKTLRLKSPKGGANRNSKPTLQAQQRMRLFSQMEKPAQQKVKQLVTDSKGIGEEKTERKSVLGNALKPQQHKQQTQKQKEKHHVSPLLERNIISFERVHVSVLNNMEAQKENLSPLTPDNVLNMIDRLKFTPATAEKQTKSNLDVDDLSTWPTPVNSIRHDGLLHEIRPRRITAAELTSECRIVPEIIIETASDESRSASLEIVVNKTFDVKRTESLESFDDSSFMEGRLSCGSNGASGGIIANNITTITATPVARPLEIIQEEDGQESSINELTKILIKTCDKSNIIESDNEDKDVTKDLKRDIKLIGTPLRKYSESMKDLSLKSPSAKISTQGSMPNLNEMQTLRSIEQNRYFHQSTTLKPQSENTPPQRRVDRKKISPRASINSPNDSSNDNLYSSQASLISNSMFNKNEILAQSSRFNLHEVDCNTRKSSPVLNRYKIGTKTNLMRKIPSRGTMLSPLTPSPDTSAQKRRSRELFVDSPTNETLTRSCESLKLPNKSGLLYVSPPKRMRMEPDSSAQRLAPKNASLPRVKNWSVTHPRKFKLAQTLSLTKRPITPRKLQEEPRIKLYDSDLYLQSYINPDPFAATTTCDPFLASTMYLDEHAVEQYQNHLKKWLNALVSIPADLIADSNTKVDLGKLFSEVRNKELMLPATKEVNSMNYLTKFRLESLRRAAVQLFLSDEMREPCSKVAVYINKYAIRIRSDRNLHLDVVMQRYILELLLCFNPLWLRLGLEVVYGEKIHLNSNSDIVGLSSFILNRLFRDKFLEQKYSKAYTLSDEYADRIKKFTLQKMLFLLLFLDKAKHHRIIKYNPCLFVKKSPYKETKEILLKLSGELLANIGDITRDLKRLGYVLQHKQTFLDEFDYAFNNLAVDLRDGIRLTRIMEIILLREDLTKKLRVPAISRLQRIFNVNLALRALQEADFELRGGIIAGDIVDGHREKTLSLLWQIIYKFRSPMFNAAAQVLQSWWRKSWLRVVVQRRIRHKEEQRRVAAAIKLQAVFRGYITRKYVRVFREERVSAALVLQKHMRRYLAQKHFYRTMAAVVLIQRWRRAVVLRRQHRHDFLTLRSICVYVQRRFRRLKFAKKLLQAAQVIAEIRAEARFRHEKAVLIKRFLRSIVLHRKLQHIVQQVVHKLRQSQLQYRSAARLQSFFKSVRLRREFQQKRSAAKCIQQHWRSYKVMSSIRREFLVKRHHIINIQRRLRANLAMKQQRRAYQQLRSATLSLQRRFRAQQLMAVERAKYLLLKQCTINMQNRRRATMLMRKQRGIYLQQRAAIIKAQKMVRATQAMRKQREAYMRMRNAACRIQCFYRARLAMKQQLAVYTFLRQCVVRIQRKWRATRLARRVRVAFISLEYYTIVLQQKYRARKLMRVQHADYQKFRQTTIFVQRHFRAKLQLRRDRDAFLRQRNAALVIQHKFRAYKLMRFVRAKYRGTRAAVSCIQEYVRGYLQMKQERATFERKRRAVIVLQRAFRAHRLAVAARLEFKRLKDAVLNVQRRYRAQMCMRQTLQEFQHQRQLIIVIQCRYRAKLLGRKVRQDYEHTRAIVIKLQRRYRATVIMRLARNTYATERSKVISLQRRFRAYLEMKRQRREYERQRQAARRLQAWFRAIRQRRRDQQSYQIVRRNIIIIQSKWRATLAMNAERKRYLSVVQKVVLVQRRLRATLKMRQERLCYQSQRRAVIVIQRRYRARLEMLKLRSQYLLLRSLIVCLQRKYRARREMLVVRRDFLLLKRTAIHLQQRYRGRLQTQLAKEQYLQLKSGTLKFQAHARGFLARERFQSLMTPEMIALIQQKKAALIIQRYWRGYRVRLRWRTVQLLKIRENIKLLKQASTAINSIRWKVRDAVRLLRGRFSASDALNVLSRLERLSRTVPHLLMGHSDFISTFCYGIMAQTIRSEIDKQLVEHCSCIILNLARYNSTTANTFQQGGLTTIAQMLMRWCDKDSQIFNTLCTLIWLFAHCPQKRKIIRDFMTTPEAIYIVRETKKLVVRKEKMMQNVRNPLATVRGQQQQQQQQKFSRRALPSLKPDYGVVQNKPYTFISSVYAFEVVLCKLGIDIQILS